MATKPSMFEMLQSIADELESVKQASLKKADDPGTQVGPSTHPTAKLDDGTVNQPEGSRAKENTEDVQEAHGDASVDAAEQVPPGTAKSDMPQVGVKHSPTGEDPETEDDYKFGVKDPGTTHPARFDDNEKYSMCSFEDGYRKSAELANAILADLAVGIGVHTATKTAGTSQNAGPQTDLGKAFAKLAESLQSEQAANDFAAGYELATTIGLTKEATTNTVAAVVAQARADGEFDADLYGTYVTELLKQASELDERVEGEDHTTAPSSDAGAPEASLGDLANMLGGAPPPPEAGDNVSDEEVLQQLAAALDELGVTPEELAAAVDEAMADNNAAPPAAEAPPAGEGMKLAQAVKAYKRSGKYQIKAAVTDRERQLRDALKAHVREILKS